MGRPKTIKPEWKLSNVFPDLPDERDYIFTASMSAATLPEIIDYRKYAREIENQGNTGSCVANATVSALELLHKKSNKDINLSRLFLYYNLREPYDHLKDKDIGSYTRDGFKRVNELGICTEETWKFDVAKINTKPDDKSYLEAINHKVQRYERIPTTSDDYMIHHTKVALAKGYPVLIGMTLGKTFYNISGALQDQKYKGVQGDSIGGHAMNIVGYNNLLNGFIVENSWGSSWGDSGFCLIPYDIIKNDCKDIWVCTKFKDIEIQEEFIVPPVEPLKLQNTEEQIFKVQRESINGVLTATESKEFKFKPIITGGQAPYNISVEYAFGGNPERLSMQDGIITYNVQKNDTSFPIIRVIVRESSINKERLLIYTSFQTEVKPVTPVEPIIPVEPVKPVVPIKPKSNKKLIPIIVGAIIGVLLISGAIYYFL